MSPIQRTLDSATVTGGIAPQNAIRDYHSQLYPFLEYDNPHFVYIQFTSSLPIVECVSKLKTASTNKRN
jgi:hypothetical protein